jgi:hypothetical protein
MRAIHAALASSIAVVAFATPAAAETASQVFKDVPAGHWAEKAVTMVAVERGFMKGFPDGTFQGDKPFTRVQLAQAVDELIRQLEVQTKVSWATEGLGGYEFQDLPADPDAQAKVLRLANHYRLFEGVPGVTSKTFEGGKTVTRYEMAKVVDRLLRLGEARGVVDPSVQPPQVYAFSDLPPTAWPYNEVKEVSDRYQVMVGFPDATFRGPEELTRYQFAASAAQTFPLVVSLVERTQERKDQDDAARRAGGLRFQEDVPLVLGAGVNYRGALDGAAGMVRGVGYAGSFFGMAEVQGGGDQTSGFGPYYLGATGAIGYALPIVTGLHVQPYLGARVTSSQVTMGGLTYGAIAYWRPAQPFGLHLRLAGTSPLGDSRGGVMVGSFLPQASGGLWWHFAPRWAALAEAGWGAWPMPASTLPGSLTGDRVTGMLGVGYQF